MPPPRSAGGSRAHLIRGTFCPVTCGVVRERNARQRVRFAIGPIALFRTPIKVAPSPPIPVPKMLMVAAPSRCPHCGSTVYRALDHGVLECRDCGRSSLFDRGLQRPPPTEPSKSPGIVEGKAERAD